VPPFPFYKQGKTSSSGFELLVLPIFEAFAKIPHPRGF